MIAQVVLDLLPLLAALYLFDALSWVPAGQVLVAGRGHRLRLVGPGLRLAGPWPGDFAAPLAWPAPLVGSAGIDVPVRFAVAAARPYEPGSYRRSGWDERPVATADGARVVVAGETALRAVSAGEAARWVERLEELRRAPDRPRPLDAPAGERAELAAAVRLHREAGRAARPAGRLGWCLFAVLFVALPAAAWAAPLRPALPWLLAAAAVAWAGCLAAGFRLAAALGRLGAPAPRTPLWTAFLVPVSAARLAVTLRSAELAGRERLVAALAVLPPAAAADLARRELVGAGHALAASAEEGWQDSWRRRRRRLERLLQAAELDPGRLLAPPARDAAATSYCPLCRDQFTIAGGGCESCGMPLRPFAESASPFS